MSKKKNITFAERCIPKKVALADGRVGGMEQQFRALDLFLRFTDTEKTMFALSKWYLQSIDEDPFVQ